MSISIQQSVHSPTGYFAFGVFYTYKDDGTQAWYTVSGGYEPTEPHDVAYWQKDTEDFGTYIGNGCTSGHAIMGLSLLSVGSLVAVIGFFIGGLAMTFLIFPLIF